MQMLPHETQGVTEWSGENESDMNHLRIYSHLI